MKTVSRLLIGLAAAGSVLAACDSGISPAAAETKKPAASPKGDAPPENTPPAQAPVFETLFDGSGLEGFDYADPKWSFHVTLLEKRGGDLTARGAHLSLQDHGNPVWYRNIYLRALGPDDAIDDAPVTPAVIAPDVLAAEKAKLDGIIAKREAQKEKAAADAAAPSERAVIPDQKPKAFEGPKPRKMPRAKVKP